MNLDLPFAHDVELDELLAEIDRAIDALFLHEVDAELKRIRAERAAAADAQPAAA